VGTSGERGGGGGALKIAFKGFLTEERADRRKEGKKGRKKPHLKGIGWLGILSLQEIEGITRNGR